MSPKPTPQQIAAMNQQQLTDLSKRDPQLAAQILLMRQGLTTNTAAPPGAPPRYNGTYLGQPRQDIESPTGHPMGQAPLASADTPQFDAIRRGGDPNVISAMGNALGNKMSDQASDNQSRAGLGEFYRKFRYKGAREK